jgi:polar amino acid transport system substrate-binding protein
MDFSNSYATGVQVIIVKEDSNVTADTLGDFMIGTQKGTTSDIYCSDDFGAEHVTTYDSSITAVQALINGQVDCVVVDNAPAQELVKANPGLKILETEYITENYAIGFAKGNTELVEAVNKALAELTADGTIQKIIDKYITAE